MALTAKKNLKCGCVLGCYSQPGGVAFWQRITYCKLHFYIYRVPAIVVHYSLIIAFIIIILFGIYFYLK